MNDNLITWFMATVKRKSFNTNQCELTDSEALKIVQDIIHANFTICLKKL